MRLTPAWYLQRDEDEAISLQAVGLELHELRSWRQRELEVGGTSAAEQWASELTGLDIPERCGDLDWIVSPFEPTPVRGPVGVP